jgi:hypothetical protein
MPVSPSDVLAELSLTRSTHPLEALAAADEHREALVAPLLLALERAESSVGAHDSVAVVARQEAI